MGCLQHCSAYWSLYVSPITSPHAIVPQPFQLRSFSCSPFNRTLLTGIDPRWLWVLWTEVGLQLQVLFRLHAWKTQNIERLVCRKWEFLNWARPKSHDVCGLIGLVRWYLQTENCDCRMGTSAQELWGRGMTRTHTRCFSSANRAWLEVTMQHARSIGTRVQHIKHTRTHRCWSPPPTVRLPNGC